MLRLLLAFALIVAFAAGAAWLADRPGSVVIDWADYRIETSAGIAVVAVLAFSLIVAVLYRAWRWLRRAPSELGEARQQVRLRRGHRALSLGMVAVAAGDKREALRQANRAASLLDEPPLTMLLSAQAAQLAGDTAAAETQFRAMLDRPETEFLGIRGLLSLAGRDGDRQAALQLARRATELRPDMPWVTEISFELQAEAGNWREAEAALDRADKKKQFPPDEVRRHRAVLRYAQALEADRADRPRDAQNLAKAASDLAPDFVPAAVMQACLFTAADKLSKAERVISDAWAKAPHPALAAAWQRIRPDDSPSEQLKRLEILKTRNPDHPETHLLIAGAAFASEDWQTARESLAGAGGEGANPDARVCRLMADYEETYNGNATAAREWLVRAAHAPVAGKWHCRACGQQSSDYEPLCPACGAFDTLRSNGAVTGGAGALQPVQASP